MSCTMDMNITNRNKNESKTGSKILFQSLKISNSIFKSKEIEQFFDDIQTLKEWATFFIKFRKSNDTPSFFFFKICRDCKFEGTYYPMLLFHKLKMDNE